MDLLAELKNLTLKLDQEGITYALCGGLALAVYDKPRATLDIDIMVPAELLDNTRRIANESGYTIAALPMIFCGGAVQIHRLTKIDAATGEHLLLDLLLVTPAIAKAWDDRRTVTWGDRKLTVVSPAGLILLKSLRGSGQDADDIEYLRSISDED